VATDVRWLSDGCATAAGRPRRWPRRSARRPLARWVGVILITFLASWVAQVALAFGPAEYFAVYFLAFASFVGMGGRGARSRPWLALAIGFAIAAIGIDTVSGSVRLTMGIDELVKASALSSPSWDCSGSANS